MKRREVHIGLGAPSLLLVIVVVSMSVLGLLAIMSARNDAQLSRRSQTYTLAEYDRAAQAETHLAQLDALLVQCTGAADYYAAVKQLLPDFMRMEGHRVTWTEEGETGRSLLCTVELLPPGSPERYRWVEHLFLVTESNFDLP